MIAAVLAIAALAGLSVYAWQTLGSREDPAPPDPAATAARFAEAWIAGDTDAIEEILVRRVGDTLGEAMAAFEPLEPTALRINVGEVIPSDQDGLVTVLLEPEMDLPDVGTWAWTSELTMERGRGRWRVRWEPTSFHPALAEGLHFTTRQGPATRAPILSADGTPLTSNGEVVTIGIEPSRVPSAERLAETLGPLVPEAVEPLQKVFARADLVPTWFYPLVTVPSSRLAGIRERVASLPGIIIREADGRVGASQGFGRHLLGRVVDADAQLAAERNVPVGTPVGVGGLEEDFDEQLRGGEVVEILAVEADGDVRATIASFSDDTAESVRTSLDPLVQEAIENALIGRTTNVAVVAVGTDGGVLGSASRPFSGYDRAFAGSYAPGAAVWSLPVLAAIQQGADADTMVECPASATVGGVRFENLTSFDLGTVSLQDAVTNGCRSSIAVLSGGLPRGTLRDLAAQLGFQDVMDGIPAPQWPAARDLAEEAAAGVGQAQLLSSVVHLASVAAAFVDGTWNPPFVLPGTTPEDAPHDPLPPAALAEAQAIFEVAGARAGLATGVGLVAGEGGSSEGKLGWASVTTDTMGLVVLVEQGSRAEAIAIVDRLLAELRALQSGR